jgi:fructose-1,6-bisphosphatase/inositol monophosphatase family enzyme
MSEIDFGPVTPNLIGVVMKESVRRAIEVIRRKQFEHEVTAKEGYRPGDADVVTDADKAAQEIYLHVLREGFPSYGVVAEENGLAVPCTHPKRDLWFTIDPLDGTKAFVRKQSHGIGTMLSLVCDGRIVAAYVGDVRSKEVYGYRPGSAKVHRVSEHGTHYQLTIDDRRPLADQMVLLRDGPHLYSPAARSWLEMSGPQKRFRDLLIDGGSIGVGMARLWKGEVGAAFLHPGPNTPWDLNPILGISNKLGFAFLSVGDGRFDPVELTPSKRMQDIPHELMIVHKSRLNEVAGWYVG